MPAETMRPGGILCITEYYSVLSTLHAIKPRSPSMSNRDGIMGLWGLSILLCKDCVLAMKLLPIVLTREWSPCGGMDASLVHL